MIERALRVKEVAAIYGVTAQTVYKWITRGDLIGMCLPGGDYRFRRDHLEVFEALCRDRKIPAPSTVSDFAAESGSSPGQTRQPVTPEPYQRGRLSAARPRDGGING